MNAATKARLATKMARHIVANPRGGYLTVLPLEAMAHRFLRDGSDTEARQAMDKLVERAFAGRRLPKAWQ